MVLEVGCHTVVRWTNDSPAVETSPLQFTRVRPGDTLLQAAE
jgi:hypothetical protein